MKQFGLLYLVVALASTAGCALFDSGTPWEGGRYKLVWIDSPHNVALYRRLSDGELIGRVEASVYAVGHDDRYVVAKQHPDGDKSRTSFFIVNVAADSDYAEPKDVVEGPLTESEFRTKSAQRALPVFSKTLRSIE